MNDERRRIRNAISNTMFDAYAQDPNGADADDVLDAYREACAIRTAEQRDVLPHGALLVRQYKSAAGWSLTEVWERRNDTWFCLAAPLCPPSRTVGIPALPALLVWHPEWSAL